MNGDRRERQQWESILALWSRGLVVGAVLLAALTAALAAFAFERLPDAPAFLGSRWILLAVCAVLSVLALGLAAFARMLRGLGRQMEQQAELAATYRQRLEEEAETVQTLREQRHDLQNQLTVLSALLQMGAVDKALRYIRNLAHGRQRQDRGAGSPAAGEHPSASEGGFGRVLDAENLLAPFLALLSAKHGSARARSVRFQVHLDLDPQTPLQIPGEPDFTRIAGNLIDNALDAAVEAKDRSPEVEVGLVWTSQNRELWVANTGPVIPSDYLDLIFTAGFSTKGGDHQGLGLPAVHRLVTERHGQVVVDTDEEQRTRFRVIFPPLDGSRGTRRLNSDRCPADPVPDAHMVPPSAASDTHLVPPSA